MLTVSQALEFYYRDRANVIALDRLYKAIGHLNQHFYLKDLSSIDVIACRKYTEARRKHLTSRHGEMHPTSDSTIARELGVLKAAANHALKWKLITMDKMPTFEIPKDLPKGSLWLFKDEWEKLLAAANGCYPITNLYLRLLYSTASRRQAIEKLEWSQVDFTNKVIHLNKLGQSITKKRRPTVPMNGLYDILKVFHGMKTNSFVLGSSSDRYTEFVNMAKKAGVYNLPERDGRPSGRMTPHVIRHTRATHLLEAGMPLYKVAQLLGDNPTTIERVYAHACTKSLEEELNKYS